MGWRVPGATYRSTLMAHKFKMEAVQSITSMVIRASQMEVLRVQVPPRNYEQSQFTVTVGSS